MSSSGVSTSNAAANLFSKQVAEFLRGGGGDTVLENSESEEGSSEKKHKKARALSGGVNAVKVVAGRYHHNKPSPVKKRVVEVEEYCEDDDEDSEGRYVEMEAVMKRQHHMKRGEDESSELSKSDTIGTGANTETQGINAMYQKFKEYKALVDKYQGAGAGALGVSGDYDDSGSITISKSQ
jgi:hypothetical protein